MPSGEIMSEQPGVGGSPVCSLSPSHGEDRELDLDSLQMLLRSFQQELRDTQRERVPDTTTSPQRTKRHHKKNYITVLYSITMLVF